MIRIFRLLAAGLLGLDVLLVFTQVILRYVFSNPQAWAEEVSRYAFVWVIYLGAIIATSRDSHIRVTVLTDLFGRRGEIASRWINWLIAVPLFGYVAYLGYRFAWQNRATEFYTIDGAPRVIYFLAVPVGFTLMTIVTVLRARFLLTPTGHLGLSVEVASENPEPTVGGSRET